MKKLASIFRSYIYCSAYLPVLFALFLAEGAADAASTAKSDIWAETTTYICTIDRPDGAKTLLALQTSGSEAQISIRMMGLNGWPEKQALAIAEAPVVYPIPPFEGGFAHLTNFETSIAGETYRFHFTVSFVPLLRAHKPIEADGTILSNRSADLSISALKQNPISRSEPDGSGYCEVQKDNEVFSIVQEFQ